MFNNHLIVDKDGEKTLYLFIDYNYEFARDFKSKKKKEKIHSIYDSAMKYIKDKNIKFNAGKIFLVVGGIVIGSLLIGNYKYDNYSERFTNDYKYIDSIDLFEDETTTNTNQTIQTEQNNNSSQTTPVQETTTNVESSKTTAEKKTNTSSAATTTNQSSGQNSTTSQTTQQSPTTTQQNNNTTTQQESTSNTASNTTTQQQPTPNTTNEQMVTLYRYNGTVQELSLEDYIIGVVGAEMPASFNIEALKAQSVLARTYALKSIAQNKVLKDDISNQVYKDSSELKSMWGASFDTYYNKIKSAVTATKGQTLTYGGSYIEAVYHSTSNGLTEDAVAVWGNSYPYLVSVDSHWDLQASSYLRETDESYDVLSSVTGISFNEQTPIEVLSRTSSNRIDKIKIGETIYTGVEFRTLLGLRSTDFDITLEGDKAVITTRGYGHGVGMSQYGSNGMAKEGYTYQQILSHYYPGTQLKS